jgi:hypothetical protein
VKGRSEFIFITLPFFLNKIFYKKGEWEMGKLTVIKEVLKSKTARTVLLAKKNSPELLMGAGVVGIIGSTVLACKATLKADLVINDAKYKLEKIKYARQELSEDYSDTDYQKDLALTYGQAAVGFMKLYAPAVTLGALSIGCILGAHGIMKKRNLALVAAYKAVEQSYSDYRKRVIAEYGEEKDRLLKNGITQMKVTEKDENGKKITKTVETITPDGLSQYARFFDESSVNWTKTPEYNLTFLKCQQNYANDQLRIRGHVFLNEIYDLLGIPRTQAGAIVGWVKDEGDGYIDFGVFDGENMQARDFVNGYERSILLDFNVSGVIYDMI